MKTIKTLLLFTITLVTLSACNQPSGSVMEDKKVEPEKSETMEKETAATTFVVTGKNYRFFMNGMENPDLIVNKGDKVRIEFTSTEGYHDWVVDEFSAATDKVQEGNSTFVEFTADKTGTFEYYCSVGQHRANGMQGNLIVE